MNFILAIVAGLVGAALGWAAVAAIALLVGSITGVSNFEGKLGIVAVFGFGPLGGLIGLIAGIWLVLRRGGQRSAAGAALRVPLVILAIAALGAAGAWYLYETRPQLGSASTGQARLDFEIRLPPGMAPPAPAHRIQVTLSTERNTMPGEIREARTRQENGRTVLVGSVDLAYRSSWRLLELKTGPGDVARIFDLKLPARPSHMKDFGSWRRVDFTATAGGQPIPAPASEAFELRARVVYRMPELEEEQAQGKR